MAKTVEPIAIVPLTDKELVSQRVEEAGRTIEEFVHTLFQGVRGKMDELRIELSAELLSQRVSDATCRIGEINAEVSALADEAVAADDEVTFRLLLTRIAILRTAFTARYKMALSAAPSDAVDDGTVHKEVGKVFERIIKDIGERRKASNRPLSEAPAVRMGVLGPAVSPMVESPVQPTEDLKVPQGVFSYSSVDPAEVEPVPEPVPEPVAELAAEASPVPAEAVPEPAEEAPPAPTVRSAREPEPEPVPTAFLPSGHKSRNGSKRSHARA